MLRENVIVVDGRCFIQWEPFAGFWGSVDASEIVRLDQPHRNPPKAYHLDWSCEQQAQMICALWDRSFSDAFPYYDTIDAQDGKKTVKIR